MTMTRAWSLICLCACLSVGQAAVADAHGEDVIPQLSDEETLIAIKEALVAEAQETESQVVNTAWLDSDGRLHESTLVQSGVRVRGIQVKSYLDAMNEPKIEIALDEKRAALPQCFTQDDQLTRTLVMRSSVQAQGGESGLLDVLYTLERRSVAALRQAFAQTEEWSLYEPGPAVDSYTQLLAGITDVQTQYRMHIDVTLSEQPADHVAEEIPKSDPVSVFFHGNPSKFPEQWVKVHASLQSTQRDEPLWTASAPIRIPVRDVTLGRVRLPDAAEEALIQTINQWSLELTEYGRCEPMHFYLAESGSAGVTISGGANSGIRLGDRLLVLDEARVPSRILEPGTLAQLSLVEVTQVSADTAVVAQTAGAAIEDLAHKVAIPF